MTFTDFDQSRRQYVKSQDEADWQRLSHLATRLGLDSLGQHLPEHAHLRIPGEGPTQPGLNCQLAVSPCGQYLASAGDSIQLWHWPSRKRLWSLRQYTSMLAFDTASRLYLCPRPNPSPQTDERALLRVDIHGQQARSQELSFSSLPFLFAFSKTQPWAVRLTDGQSQELNFYSLPDFNWTHSQELGSYPWAELRQLTILASQQRIVWITEDSTLTCADRQNDDLIEVPLPSIRAIAAHPQRDLVTIVTHERILEWDADTQEIQSIEAPLQLPHCRALCLSQDARVLILSLENSRLWAWDVEQQDWLWKHSTTPDLELQALPHSPDFVTLSTSQSSAIEQRSVATGECHQPESWRADAVAFLKFSEDSAKLHVGSFRPQFMNFQLANHQRQISHDGQLFDLQSDLHLVRKNSRLFLRRGHETIAKVTQADGLLDRDTLIYGDNLLSFGVHRVFLFQTLTQELSIYLELDDVIDATLCPKTHLLAIQNRAGALQVWDLESRRMLWSEYFGAFTKQLFCFSPDGSKLWRQRLQPQPAQITVFEARSGAVFSQRQRPTPALSALAAGPGLGAWVEDPKSAEPRIVIADDELQGLTEVHGHSATIRALAFSPNKRWLASGDDTGDVILWPLSTLNDSV